MACPKGCCPDYRTHISQVQIGGFPSKITHRENKLAMDMRAYKNLRRDGLQPRSVDGSYVVERAATTEREVELGRPLDDQANTLLDEIGT